MTIDAVYQWFSHMQADNGLLASSEAGNQVSLYDNALAALVFISQGEYGKAEHIFDFFKDRLNDEFTHSGGGFAQFRDQAGRPQENRPHRWLGDNAWLLIALHNYVEHSGNNKYQTLIRVLEQWIRSLQDADGGIWGGYDYQGEKIPKITEGMLDAFIAIPGYDDFHRQLLGYLKKERYDKQTGILTAQAGPYKYPLDLISWGYAMLPAYPKEVLFKAGMFFLSKKSTKTAQEVFGYCFDTDRDTIWIEGTGEMAVSFQLASLNATADFLIKEMEKMLIPSDTFPNTTGLPYATNPGTGYEQWELWEQADQLIAVSSSAWYIFAKVGYDPYHFAKGKAVEDCDKFYL